MKVKISLRSIVQTFLAAAAIGGLPAQASSIEDVTTAFRNGQFDSAIRAYDGLAASDQNRPAALFCCGASYLRNHNIEMAQKFLQRASESNLPEKQRANVAGMLTRISTLEQLRPPFYQTYKSDGYVINLYVSKSAWGKTMAAQMPKYLERAKEAFGNESAELNFYLFDEREPYDRFFSAWGGDTSAKKHRGTGGVHLVEFCQFFPTGAQIGAGNVNDLYARCLHEYSHGLCATIYGELFGRSVPEWLNESMADLFGFKYRPDLLAKQPELLTKLAARIPAPSYQQICRNLYDVEGGYTIPNVLLLSLLNGKDVSCYKTILETAKANGGNFEAALRSVTGNDPQTVYQGIVQKYWHSKAVK